MKQKLISYIKLREIPEIVSMIVMLVTLFYVAFSYEFLTTCILAGIVSVLSSIDTVLKNDKYYRVKNILLERYGE